MRGRRLRRGGCWRLYVFLVERPAAKYPIHFIDVLPKPIQVCRFFACTFDFELRKAVTWIVPELLADPRNNTYNISHIGFVEHVAPMECPIARLFLIMHFPCEKIAQTSGTHVLLLCVAIKNQVVFIGCFLDSNLRCAQLCSIGLLSFLSFETN